MSISTSGNQIIIRTEEEESDQTAYLDFPADQLLTISLADGEYNGGIGLSINGEWIESLPYVLPPNSDIGDRIRFDWSWNAESGDAYVALEIISGEIPDVTDIYDQACLIPAAISSGLDNTGEERIHAAPIINVTRPVADPVDPPGTLVSFYSSDHSGGDFGTFKLIYELFEMWNEETIATEELYNKILAADEGDVVITGIALDEQAEYATLNSDFSSVDFVDVSYPMITFVIPGNTRLVQYYFNELDTPGWYWIRLSVSGDIYYGAMRGGI